MRTASEKVHRTKLRLLDAVDELLLTEAPDQITVEQVLTGSGVSSGSLYHHFRDFPDLLDQAYARQYALLVEGSIANVGAAFAGAHDAVTFADAVKAASRTAHGPDRTSARALRAWIVGQGVTRPEFAMLLSGQQERLTQALMTIITEGQERGWVRAELDPRALSVFIQAYTFGSVVDDFAAEHMDPEAWLSLVGRVISTVFIADASS